MATRSKSPKSPAKAKKAETGHSPATLAFAAKVVRARDVDRLSWEEVAAKVGVPYGANGSSRLRRAYQIGGGATVGVRKATKPGTKSGAPKTATRRATVADPNIATPRRRAKATPKKATPKGTTPRERRAARQAAAAKAASAK